MNLSLDASVILIPFEASIEEVFLSMVKEGGGDEDAMSSPRHPINWPENEQ